MATNNPDNNALASLLASLAGQAISQDMSVLGLNFPDYWDIQSSFESNADFPNQNFAQGFLATGRKEVHNPDVEIAVLALGVSWAQYFRFYQSNSARQVSLSSNIFENAPPAAKIQSFFQKAYLTIQKDIYTAISNNKFLPEDVTLNICGIGLGAPLAQLAAIDLRPDHDWEGVQRPIKFNYQPPSFVFSAPNVANQAFATFYNQTVVTKKSSLLQSYTYTDAKHGLTVDQFPSAPVNDNHQPLGVASIPTTTVLPAVDVPWAERSANAYINVLGGNLNSGALVKPTFLNLPSKMKLPFVATLAKLVGETYHQAQNPGDAPDFPLPSYVAAGSIMANDRLFAIIYKNSILKQVIIAFRGAITWDETFNITSNSASVTSTVFPRQGRIHGGVHQLYFNTPTQVGGKIMFKDELWTTVQPLLKEPNWQVSTTGHGIGGALASLAAIDLLTNRIQEVNIGTVTTFGSMPFANPSFVKAYNQKLKSNSFAIRRIYDQIALAFLSGPFRPNPYEIIGTAFALNGQLIHDEETYHSISSYIQLLNAGVSS